MAQMLQLTPGKFVDLPAAYDSEGTIAYIQDSPHRAPGMTIIAGGGPLLRPSMVRRGQVENHRLDEIDGDYIRRSSHEPSGTSDVR